MSRFWVLHTVVWLLIFISAFGVVLMRHEARQHFVLHQAALSERDALNLEWTQLQLEQATWAVPARIEAAARERLDMVKPAPEQIIFVEEAAWGH